MSNNLPTSKVFQTFKISETKAVYVAYTAILFSSQTGIHAQAEQRLPSMQVELLFGHPPTCGADFFSMKYC